MFLLETMGWSWLHRTTLLFLLVLSGSYTRFIDYPSADNVTSHLPIHKCQQQFECKMLTLSLGEGTFCFRLPDGTQGPSWCVDRPNSGKTSFGEVLNTKVPILLGGFLIVAMVKFASQSENRSQR